MKMFAQVPHAFIISKHLTHLQFRIYSLLEFYRFIEEPEITSNKISNALGVHRDTIRRELNKMQNIFSEFYPDMVNIYFLDTALNTPSTIVIHYNYLNTSLRIDSKSILSVNNASELNALKSTLQKSKYFKKYKPDLLFELAGTDKTDELIRGIVFCDNKKKIKNPIPYLRSCFKAGFFKYDKATVSLDTLDKKTVKGLKTNSDLLFGLTHNDFTMLKGAKTDEYKFFSFQDSYERIIYHATYRTKPANIKNALDKFNVNYTVYLRGE